MYDPAQLHFWTETRRRGEWPTTTISPACTPTIIRTVSTADIDRAESAPTPDLTDANVCPVCAEVQAAVAKVGA